jgi:hypothetical protein
MSYPVVFEADYVETRNRASAFFRALLAIPLLLVVYLYAAGAGIAVVIAWFALLFTGRYPEGLYNFNSGFIRFFTRVSSYNVLMTDAYPAFGGAPDDNYPIRVHFAGPLPQYSRAKVFFRGLLQVPLLFLRNAINGLLQVGAVGAWFVIVFTGKLPRGLHDLLVLGNSYIARSDAYVLLLTETYPPFQDEQTRTAGVPEPA